MHINKNRITVTEDSVMEDLDYDNSVALNQDDSIDLEKSPDFKDFENSPKYECLDEPIKIENSIKSPQKPDCQDISGLQDPDKNIIVYAPRDLDYMMQSALKSINKKKKHNKRIMNQSTNYMKNNLKKQSENVQISKKTNSLTPIK